MKTVMFYSYKGGSGRTLALANYANVLIKTGKKVVMLDLDFEAPGLVFKFDKHKQLAKKTKEEQGYLDYLLKVHGDDMHRIKNESTKCDFMKRCALPIDSDSADNAKLILIPAGDSYSKGYWAKVASDQFRRLLYFTPSEQGGRPDVSTKYYLNNLNAFENDKKIIAQTFKADYLLIDAKAGAEISAVFMLTWLGASDVLLLMAAANPESLHGTAMFWQAVIANKTPSGKSELPKIIPTLCRVPEGFKDWAYITENLTNLNGELDETIAYSFNPQPDSNSSWRILHECRQLEAMEQILLASDKTADKQLMLSHDYVSLFEAIDPNIEIKDEDSFRSLLNMAKDVEMMEQYFIYHVHKGEIINPEDGKANIALRIKTLRSMMNDIYNDFLQSDQPDSNALANAAFKRAGLSCGKSFGDEKQKDGMLGNVSCNETEEKLLKAWCDFDSRSGFGKMSLKDSLQCDMNGEIIVDNNIFNLKTDGEENFCDLNPFFEGYIAGVLESLIDKQRREFSVVAIKQGQSFTFEPRIKTN